jgi:hypothetical protein
MKKHFKSLLKIQFCLLIAFSSYFFFLTKNGAIEASYIIWAALWLSLLPGSALVFLLASMAEHAFTRVFDVNPYLTIVLAVISFIVNMLSASTFIKLVPLKRK